MAVRVLIADSSGVTRDIIRHHLECGGCQIVAETKTEDDELLIHDCDLDATRFGKETMFDFARHRRTEHYGLIVSQTGIVPPKG